jgi:hypothetical protein
MQIIKQMKDALPAPFEEGTNVAVVENQQVLYRFPADASLGFIELLTSPWNQDRMILAVVGTNQSGVQQSGLALTGLLRSSLKGNFVLVNGETITVADTRTGLGLAGFNSNENAVARLPVANSGTPVPDLSRSGLTSTISWIPWAIFGLLVAIGLVIFVAAYTRRRAVIH